MPVQAAMQLVEESGLRIGEVARDRVGIDPAEVLAACSTGDLRVEPFVERVDLRVVLPVAIRGEPRPDDRDPLTAVLVGLSD